MAGFHTLARFNARLPACSLARSLADSFVRLLACLPASLPEQTAALCLCHHHACPACEASLIQHSRAAFAYATAAASPNMDIANAILFTVPTVLLFGSGYLLRWNDIPRYILWCALLRVLQPASSTAPDTS